MRNSARGQVHALYRFFDDAGELLYVGITLNPAARWKQHAEEKPWWTEVGNITVEPHPSRASVLEAEALAIKTEHPRYNKAHNRTPTAPAVGVVNWRCDVCWELIADEEGVLVARHEDISNHRADSRDWDEVYDEDGLVSEAAFASYPRDVHWHILHDWCDQGGDGYSILVEHVRTHIQLLAWTVHLSEKSWVSRTDWNKLMRRLTGDLPA